jgi:hypothetical protein
MLLAIRLLRRIRTLPLVGLVRPERLPLPLARIWLARRTLQLQQAVRRIRRRLRLLPARILLAIRIP